MKREEVEELLVTIYEPDIKSLAQSWLEKDKALSLIFAADKKETDDWVDYGQRVERAILEARQLLDKGEKK